MLTTFIKYSPWLTSPLCMLNRNAQYLFLKHPKKIQFNCSEDFSFFRVATFELFQNSLTFP